jgi:hypothetical protein
MVAILFVAAVLSLMIAASVVYFFFLFFRRPHSSPFEIGDPVQPPRKLGSKVQDYRERPMHEANALDFAGSVPCQHRRAGHRAAAQGLTFPLEIGLWPLRRLVRKHDGLVYCSGRGKDAPDPIWPLHRTIQDGRIKNGVIGERRREIVE